MRWRPGQLALLLFQALWLNVVLPGHTRGILALPGSSCEAGACGAGPASGFSGPPRQSCCPPAIESLTARAVGPLPGARHKAPPPASHCAICFFAARVTPPPAVDLAPPPLEPLGRVVSAVPGGLVSLKLPPPYDGRAPPGA